MCILSPMARYWRIYRAFYLSSLARELEFRANFFAKVLQNLVWIGFFVMILLVVYGKTDSIAGWSKGHAFVLGATVFVMNSVSSAFFFSLTDIPQQVRLGTLDFVISKPVDSQFWVSMRRFNFDQIGALIAGVIMVLIGVHISFLHPSFGQWTAYVVSVVASIAIFYAFSLAMMTTGIWLVRVDNLFVLGESIVQVARYPLDIYPTGAQRFLTYVVPLGLLSTVPARQLVHPASPVMALLSLGWAALAVFLSRRFWRYAMRHYTSASS
jgi:viologen exporter family transport system permease protein